MKNILCDNGSNGDKIWTIKYEKSKKVNIRYYLIFCMKQFLFRREWKSLQDLSLYKEYRHLGIGTALMRAMLQLLKDKGYKQASLSVQKANYAVELYRKVGFEVVDENEEEYIMIWKHFGYRSFNNRILQ